MTSQSVSDIIANELSVNTYNEMIKKMSPGTTLDVAKHTAAMYFDSMLNCHGNVDVSASLRDFLECSEVFKMISKNAKDEYEKEDLQNELVCLHSDGFFEGYIAAVKDAETFICRFISRSEESETPADAATPAGDGPYIFRGQDMADKL